MAKVLWGLICACVLLLPTSSLACWVGPFDALIHSDVPDRLPEGLVILEVEIRDAPEQNLYGPGLIADVRHVRQGFLGSVQTVVLKATAQSTCESPFDNGRRGLIVGFLMGEMSGSPWIEPLFAPGASDFRLESGTIFRWRAPLMTPSTRPAERADP